MSRKPDKAARRKARLKAKKVLAEQHRHQLCGRIAAALLELCADSLPEYIDDSKGIDLVGRTILWRIGMTAWNLAVSGKKEIDDDAIKQTKLGAESEEIVRKEINNLIRKKYERYPSIQTIIAKISPCVTNGVPGLKVSLGDNFPAVPIPVFNDTAKTFTPEQILTKRKGLRLSQVKFAAALGVSVKKVSAWEHGKSEPTPEEKSKISSL